MRLDAYLAANGLAASRQKALWLIENGYVSVDGKITMKASTQIEDDMNVDVADVKIYVGRGGLKLEGFFEDFELDVRGFSCLDIGASTGGFTEVLLGKGANTVVSVDVGSMQLADSLKNDHRVKSYENTDIRAFSHDGQFDLVVVDLSFISTKDILKEIVRHSKKYLLLLVKPQFEVGKNIKRNKKGVVTDVAAIERSLFDFECEAKRVGLNLLAKLPCKFTGKEGNQEYFFMCEVVN